MPCGSSRPKRRSAVRRARRSITPRWSSGSIGWELLPDLEQLGVTKRGYHYWNLEHELLARLSFDALLPEDTRYPFNLHLGQADLAAVVLRHLLLNPGAEVRWRARAVAVIQDDAGATVTVQTPAGEHIRARWVIAADGGHSGIAARSI